MIKFESKKGQKLFLFGLILCFCFYFLTQQKAETVITLGIHEGSSWDVPQGQDNHVLDDIIKNFEKKHPGVKVVYDSGIRKSDYSDWLADKIVTGKQPDVFMVPEKDFNLFATNGVLYRLDKLIKKDIKPNQFYSVSYRSGSFRNSQYALPFESNPMMMCINKDLLNQSGFDIPNQNWTMEDFYTIVKSTTKDTDGDNQIDQFGIVDYDWSYGMSAFGNAIFTNDGSHVRLNTSRTKQAMHLITNLNSLSGSYQVSTQDFDKGKVVFRPMTMAEYRTYKPYPYHVAKYSSFEWTCVPMPKEKGLHQTSQVDTSLFAISKRSKNVKLSWELLKSLTYDKRSQQELVKQSQGVSVLKDVMKSSTTKKILQEDNFGSNSLRVETLDRILKDGAEKPKFKLYNKLNEEADYLISQSLKHDTIDLDLASIEKKLIESLRQ